MKSPEPPLKLGTRRSALAVSQSRQVADVITERTGRAVELVEITTYGDTSREALAQIGGTGVFVSALRDALADGEVDLAVHSLKDLPTAEPDGLVLAAIPWRANPRDALVSRDRMSLERLAADAATSDRPARIGTGSPRRMAQLRGYAAEHGMRLETVPIRGNVESRIGYVRSGELDGVVLAAAGLERLDRIHEVSETIAPEVVLPAPGQGALAVECSTANAAGELGTLLGGLDDPATRAAVTAERAVLATLEAGCSAPVGALAEVGGGGSDRMLAPPEGEASGNVTELRLRAVVGSVDGGSRVQLSTTGSVLGAAELGRELADSMLAQGAAGLMGERVL